MGIAAAIGRRGAVTAPPAPPEEPPPPGQDAFYGPVLGAPVVRAGVGPRSVADPGGGVAFTNGSNIQTLINANAYNTHFVTSTPGTYNNFRGLVYSAKHPRFYFVGNAASYSINGGSTDNIGLNGTGNGTNGGLEVHGGTWTAYATPTGTSPSYGPINIGGGGGTSVIEDAVFTLNNQIGVGMYVNVGASSVISTMRLSYCTFLNNGRYGISGSSVASNDLWFYTPTVEYCLIDGNPTRTFVPSDDQGGHKFSYTHGAIFRYNWYKNNGQASWFDGYNRYTRLYDCVLEDNDGNGVFFEISRGGAIFEHNYLHNNGSTTNANYPFNSPQFFISCTPSDATASSFPGPNITSEIRYNHIDTAGYQSPVVLCTHGYQPTTERTRNWYVHHNRLISRGSSGQSRNGLADATTAGSDYPTKVGDIGSAGANNRFNFNEYQVANINGNYWEHDTASLSPGAINWAAFQAKGHEANGTRVAI